MRRVALRVVAGALIVSAALGGLLTWRLARGPIEVPLLTSYVQQALGAEGGPRVRVGSTEVLWDRGAHELRLRARDVEVSSPTGVRVGVVPSVALGLSLRALLHGAIAPTDLVAHGIRIRLALRADGTVDLGLGTGGQGTVSSSARDLADRLFGASRADASRAWLRSVVLHHGEVELVDPANESSWRARDVDVLLRRAPAGLEVELTGRLAFGPMLVPMRMAAAYRRDADRTDVRLTFRGLDPSALAASMPAELPAVLRRLSALRLSLDGRVVLVLDAALKPLAARLKLVGGPGTIGVGALPGGSLSVARARAKLAVDRKADGIAVEVVSLDLGRSAVQLRGEVRGLDGPGRADLAVSATHVPVDEMRRYWPEDVAADARRWVLDNVAGGHVHRATARVSGAVADAVPTSLQLDGAGGSFAYDGVTVRCLPTMSPVTGVAGTGTFSERGLGLRVARGRLGGLEVVHATVDVGRDRTGRLAVALDGSVRGLVAEAVTLLEQQQSLGSRAVGVSPADVGGTVTARMTLAIPLQAGAAGTIRPTASAALHELSIARLPRGWVLTDGELAVGLAGSTVSAKGRGRLQGVALTLAGTSDLDSGRRTLELRGDVGPSGFAALGFAGLPAFAGDVGVQARYVATRPGVATLEVAADLARIAIESLPAAFRKGAGIPGSVHIDLGLSADALATVDRFELDLGKTSVSGSATLSEGGTRWQTIDARAALAPPAAAGRPGRVTLRLAPEGRAPRLTVTSDDAGALASALGATFAMVGGQLRFVGDVDVTAPDWPIDGVLDVGRFTLTRAPILARAASLVSLSGIAGVLSGGRGIAFDRLNAQLAHRGGVMTIKSARVSGRSLGISVRGAIDWPGATLALEGSLVPAYYGLNEAPGRIPVVGKVLTGARREGVQVIDFEAKGPLAGPQVSARPSSAAPGVMRDLLRLLSR